jgi:hypothetical protein
VAEADVRWLLYYLAVGAGWLAVSMYARPASDRVREKISEEMRTLPPLLRAARLLGLLLGGLIWPLWLLLMISPRLFPRFQGSVNNAFRREFLDRDGLLTPQMPATRCPTCRGAMSRLQKPCVKCKVDWDLDHCDTCCNNETCLVHRDWTCPNCQPNFDRYRPCPWCGTTGGLVHVRDAGGSNKVDLGHSQPWCDGWQRMAASGDREKFFADALVRGEIRPYVEPPQPICETHRKLLSTMRGKCEHCDKPQERLYCKDCNEVVVPMVCIDCIDKTETHPS